MFTQVSKPSTRDSEGLSPSPFKRTKPSNVTPFTASATVEADDDAMLLLRMFNADGKKLGSQYSAIPSDHLSSLACGLVRSVGHEDMNGQDESEMEIDSEVDGAELGCTVMMASEGGAKDARSVRSPRKRGRSAGED